MTQKDGPVCGYDFTFPETKISSEELKIWCKEHCKQWTFQLECGESGYVHYQGRISLKTKKAMSTMLNEFPKGGHLSKTSKQNEGNNFYVTKEETRIGGPWSNKDIEIYIPKQIRMVEKLYPWQMKILELAQEWDTRHIHCIIDLNGNIGKTTLVTYFGAKRMGIELPLVNDFKDIMRMVMDAPKLGVYLIDMPRAINKERLFGIYGAIEKVKSGYAFDDRYHFKYEYFDCPNIFVFTNRIPDLNLLSRDRWILWEVKNNELVKFNPTQKPIMTKEQEEEFLGAAL